MTTGQERLEAVADRLEIAELMYRYAWAVDKWEWTLLDQVFVAGMEIVAPVVIALIISDAAFGLVSRAVPQMNVFFVGLPAKIMLGFLVIGATLPFVASHLSDQLQASVQQALQTLGS